MNSPPPAPWTFAARAAYFGDRVCAFCEHRNPAGASFCNDCGSPLHLKPCNQCAAVNEQGATHCYRCGAEGAALFPGSETPPLLPVPDVGAAPAAPSGIGAAATATQPTVAPAMSRAHSRLLRPSYMAAIAAILVVGAYAAFRTDSAAPDALGVGTESVAAGKPLGAVSQPLAVGTASGVAAEWIAAANESGVASEPAPVDKQTAPATVAAAPVTVEPEPSEANKTVALHAPIATSKLASLKHASARQRPAPAPVTKRASAPQWRASLAGTSRAARTIAATHVRTRVAEIRKARQPDSWQPMHVSLTQCGDGLLTRIVCDQRVRRRFCEGRWGASPECASGITNDRGQ